MAIYDYLPKYKQVEPNNLKGLQPGFVVSQMEVAEAAKADITVGGKGEFMENGVLCSISKDGIIKAVEGSPVFLHFTEELLTLPVGKKYFAVNLKEENPRLVQLIPGDEWMSSKELTLSGALSGRIVEVTKTSGMGKSDDWFSCETMANGDKGHHYMYIG